MSPEGDPRVEGPAVELIAKLQVRAASTGWGEPGGADGRADAVTDAFDVSVFDLARTQVKAHLAGPLVLGLLAVTAGWEEAPHSGQPHRPTLTISPAGKVGFTTTCDGQFLEVRPKINDADYLALMLLAAGDDGGLKPEHAAVLADNDRPDSLVELLVVGLVDATEKLVQRIGLRRQHRRVEETLRARLRGTVDVPRYLTRFANGRPLDIPCRFERHEVDTLPNRTLLWAVRLARGVLDEMPHLAEWRDRARRLERHFEGEGVQLTPVRPGDLRGLERLPPGFAPYEPALAIARLLIRDLTPTIADGEIQSISLAIDLAGVFEKAFASLCLSFFGARSVRGQDPWSLSLGDKGTIKGHMRPDVVVRNDHTTLVVDTKWKSVIDRAIEPAKAEAAETDDGAHIDTELILPSPIQNVRFNYGDLYQMWSYLHVAEAREPERTVVGALVYPVAIKGKAPVPVEVFPTGIAETARHRRLYLVPWNVHRDVFHGTGRDNLKATLEALLTEQR